MPPLPHNTARIDFRLLTGDDGAAVRRILESDPSYFVAIHGFPPEFALGGEVESLYSALPPGRSYDDKFLVGGSTPAGLFMFMDLIRAYPTPRAWTLGWLFVALEYRRRGMGREALGAVERWVQECGGTVVRASLPAANRAGFQFLEGAGYRVTEERPDWSLGGRVDTLLVLEHTLAIDTPGA